MGPSADCTLSLGRFLEMMAERLAADGVADPPPPVEMIASRFLGLTREQLDSEAGRPPTPEESDRLRRALDRITAGEPAAYILGVATFLGREFEVTRDTLIPRRDTEELVRIVLHEVRSRLSPGRLRLLELGTGTGCVAITLALELPAAAVVATDLSDACLAVAGRNARRHGVAERMTLVQGDLFEPLDRLAGGGPFDAIVSNPPYIPTGRIGAMGPAVAHHEPHLALDGGADGLDFHRRILAEAPRYLAPGGLVLLEHESDEGTVARRIGEQAGTFEDVRVLRDSRGLDRVLTVRRR